MVVLYNQVMIVEEQVYDPELSQAQKVLMLKNGLFEFDDIPNARCCCGHNQSEHLDCIDCCLFAKDEICMCERFLENGATIPKGKIPSKKKKEVQEDLKLNSYIQTLAKM
jgi:hypothetical protein